MTQRTFIREILSTFQAHVPVDKVSRYKAVKLPSNYEIPEGKNSMLSDHISVLKILFITTPSFKPTPKCHTKNSSVNFAEQFSTTIIFVSSYQSNSEKCERRENHLSILSPCSSRQVYDSLRATRVTIWKRAEQTSNDNTLTKYWLQVNRRRRRRVDAKKECLGNVSEAISDEFLL